MSAISKTMVANRFNKSRSTYNNHAIVQKEITEQLAVLIDQICGCQYNNIAEIGCGTGFLTHEILKRCSPSQYFINDLNPDVKENIDDLAAQHNFNNYNFLPGDAEKIQFPKKLDLVISSSTFQWFNNLPAFFNKVSNILCRENGYLAFSSFGENNFMELKKLDNIGLQYHSLKETIDLLNKEYHIVKTLEYTRPLYFNNALEVLKHIKNSGTNGVKTNNLSPLEIQNLIKNYENKYMDINNKVPLTYHPYIIIARKK